MSLRARLTLFSAAGIALVLAVAAGSTYLIVRGQLRAQVDSTLVKRLSDGISITVSQTEGGSQSESAPAPLPLPGDEKIQGTAVLRIEPPFGSSPLYAQVVDWNGSILLRGDPSVTLPVAAGAVAVARGERDEHLFDATVKGTHLRVLATSMEPTRALLVAVPLTEVDSALDRLLVTLAIIVGAGVALAAVIGGGVAYQALRPVRKLTEAAESIADTHDLGTRIGDSRSDELGRLGASFDKMLGELEAALAAQRRLVSDASHELRTPLTTLRTNIEVLREGEGLSDPDREKLLASLSAEIEELTALVTDVVDLARGSQRAFHLREIRLDEVAVGVVERARSRYPAVTFELASEPSTVLGDYDRVERAIANLVDNAVKWSPPGGTVKVAALAGEVTISDQGPGVAEADRPFIFERFYRADDARGRPGSGLGLAIVRQVAETHGGSVRVEAAPGGGARFHLALVAPS